MAKGASGCVAGKGGTGCAAVKGWAGCPTEPPVNCCDDGICCWSDDATLDFTYTSDFYQYERPVRADPPDCTVTVHHHVEITWTSTAAMTDCGLFDTGTITIPGAAGPFGPGTFPAGMAVTLDGVLLATNTTSGDFRIRFQAASNGAVNPNKWDVQIDWGFIGDGVSDIILAQGMHSIVDPDCTGMSDTYSSGCVDGNDDENGATSVTEDDTIVVTANSNCCRNGDGDCTGPGTSQPDGDCA